MYSDVRRAVVVGMLVAGLVLAACGGDQEPLGPTATVPQATTTTDPYAIPEVIDEAYVNRVLAGLDAAVGDVTRLVVSSRTIAPDTLQWLKAFYVGDALQLQVDLFQADMLNQFAGYREVPGDQTTIVTRLIDVSPTCVFAQVHKDLASVTVAPDPALATQWIALTPLDPNLDPLHYNRTGWVFIYDGFDPDQSEPKNPCAES